jgi:hypothetical protein
MTMTPATVASAIAGWLAGDDPEFRADAASSPGRVSLKGSSATPPTAVAPVISRM